MIGRILDTKPDSDPYLQSLVNAFWIIEKGAHENGTIPVSEIEAYCRLFDVQEVEDFVQLIYSMNVPVIEYKNKQTEKALNKNRKK